MRFHLIDRVDHVEPMRSVRARKLTSAAEEHWIDTPSGPVMPPALVLEALCQAGTWLVMISTERRQRAALLSLEQVRFLGAVRPGDVIDVVGTVDSIGERSAVFSGVASVAGVPVLEARHIMCALIEASDLERLDDTERMQRLLTRAGA
jgi:3-hydroxyacyl-[acyl-carrier-protein] dehydratase